MKHLPHEGYHFVPRPKVWDDSCHKYPCSETRAMDLLMNDLNSREFKMPPDIWELCQEYGRRQNAESKRNRNLKVSDRSDEVIQAEGYAGQWAVAMYFGLPFVYTGGTYRMADFPEHDIEVKTRTVYDYDLKIRPDDPDRFRVVRVMFWGNQWPVRLMGWITALEGKQFPMIDPKNKGQPFHAVPNDSLRPMAELKALLHERRS